MGTLGNIVHAIENGTHDVADSIADAAIAAGDATGHIGKELVRQARKGVGAGAIALGLGGALGMSPMPGRGRGKGRRPGPPRPADPSYTCGFDSSGRPMVGREPFPLLSRLNIAAGAQAINTDLGDWFTTAATSDLTTNNQFPYNADFDEANTFVSGNLAAAYVETLAVLMGVKVFERVNTSQELAQYALADLSLTYSMTGVVTSGAASTTFDVNPDGVPFEAHYETGQSGLVMAIRTVRAFTSVATLDFTLMLSGSRRSSVGRNPSLR